VSIRKIETAPEQDERVLMIEKRMQERSGKLDELTNSFGETVNPMGSVTPGVQMSKNDDTIKKGHFPTSKLLAKPPL